MKTCIEINLAGYGISLHQVGVENFTVKYHKQVKTSLTYPQAAAEFGACIMHALACEGKLDNRMET